MSWSDCGTDSKGRPIGYAFEATCDYPGCDKQIDRGLSYACGGMHGLNGNDCEGYFCEAHRTYVENDDFHGQVCLNCAKFFEESDDEDDWDSALYECPCCGIHNHTGDSCASCDSDE